jgi:hypothetical protein
MSGRVEQQPLQRAPQRPRARYSDPDVVLWAYPTNLSNPKHPAGTDPRNVDVLMRLEMGKRLAGGRK